jgi:prolyl-tRNA synthetase
VVTHHRLKNVEGKLIVDPDARLEEPYIIRPTSETIIGDAFSRWVKSYRDLPLLINQWANVMRWEMRTRLFLRTSEFLWQEGHTAHASREEAMEETMRILELYRDFAESTLAIPVVAGEKPANERFPGADNTFSIEAMMQDGKALQAGTSHYLGQHFAEAQNIRFQDETGALRYCHTTSWGVSTRLIGCLIGIHGDDDGLRLPPAVAPRQIVVVPMLRDRPEDADVLTYGETLVKRLHEQTVFGERIRALLDIKKIRSAEKRWDWVRKGAPIIVEVGPRDAAGGHVTFIRREDLRDGDKVKSQQLPIDNFVAAAPQLLRDIQDALHKEAGARLRANISSDAKTFADLEAYFGTGEDEDDDESGLGSGSFRGWVRAPWARPEGAELDQVDARLKKLKLTLRNVPMGQGPATGTCLFTGRPAVEDILIARSY